MKSTKSVQNSEIKKVLKGLNPFKLSEWEESIDHFSNSSALSIIIKDNDVFISANELNQFLKETDYGVNPRSCHDPSAHPLFDKHGEMHDVLLDVFTLNNFICEVGNIRGAYLVDRIENMNTK